MKSLLRIGYQFENKEKIILRDFLAMERTRLANERTLMAYVRTSLFFLTGGLTLLQFERFQNMFWLAYFAMVLSVVMMITGIYRYLRLNSRVHDYYEQIEHDRKQMGKNWK